MDVRRAAADGVEQQLVDETHDGRVFDVVSRNTVTGGIVVAARDIEVFEIEPGLVLGQQRRGRVGLLGGLVDGFLQLVVFDDHGLDAEASLELDLVDGVQVGGICHREEQALAAAEKRQAAMLLKQLVLDQLDGVDFDGMRVEVVEGHAELGRGGDGDVTRLGRTGGNELGDEARLPVLGGLQRIEHGRFFDHAVLHQPLRQAAEARASSAKR